MGSVTVEKLDNLYWLGRYTERAYRLIHLYMDGYDRMIDGDRSYYKKICEALAIPDTYASAEDFIAGFAFDRTNGYSIASGIYRAYDNALVLRDEISTTTLSYIHLAVGELTKASESSAPLYNLQRVLDNILAFWGCLDDLVDDESIRNTVKAGKRIERLDFYLRLKMPREALEREIDRLTARLDTTALQYNKAALRHTEAIVADEPLDHDAALTMAMSIIK